MLEVKPELYRLYRATATNDTISDQFGELKVGRAKDFLVGQIM
jgi:hypothetical protein